ncbi:uncharacterized protein LOC120717994 [Simochromis diagramma]|uniref:uncharacterized protein LOC120717994 n=1 Tax=Simochromis diagramma TaxID=43689 RepID=UPI001A7E2737|nr:uncharacterized protein LOC120717994 [Simochromis diagramma]
MDPLFGNIPDNRATTSGKTDQREKYPAKKEFRGSSFATNISAENKRLQETNVKTENSIKTVSAFEKPCLYCQQPHTLASCGKIKNQPHKERVDFLKSKGLCFGCLVYGHLSKFCKRRMECKECSLKHPDILHMGKKESSVETERKDVTDGTTRSHSQLVKRVTHGQAPSAALMDAQGTPLASGIDVKGPPIEEIAAEVPVVDGGSLTGAWKTPESTLAGIRWICSVYR